LREMRNGGGGRGTKGPLGQGPLPMGTQGEVHVKHNSFKESPCGGVTVGSVANYICKRKEK